MMLTKSLLSHIRQVESDNVIWEESQEKQKFTVLASDMGLKGHQGTFGRLLSTQSNAVLVEGADPIDGPYNTT